MLGRTHFLFGLFLSLFSFLFFSFENYFLFVLLFLFGSLFPDVDRSNSIVGRNAKFVSRFFSHRGFFHSFYALILFSLIIYLFFDLVLALAFLFGFLFHLVFDSFTKKGVSFFIFDKRVRGSFTSGGLFDMFLQKALLLCNIFLLIVILEKLVSDVF
jgi:membrane-bound metal-dependent hydrolase YbcI (DUF457 family)|tara:strand:+ start:96 stop:566 length:471 start_codon:yes stop_codon:yes gene_type:complete